MPIVNRGPPPRTPKQNSLRRGVRDQFDYAYDDAGNRLSRDVPSGLYATNDRDETYEYDGLQRLNSMKRGTLSGGTISGPADQAWGLDALGNWVGYSQHADMGVQIDHIRTHNAANEISNIAEDGGTQFWEAPAYDEAGNTTWLPVPTNPGQRFQLKYDAWNRLVEAKAGADLVQKNEFDGLNRRIVKRTDHGALDWDFDEIRHYYYNEDWQVVEERVGADPATARVDAQYVWHPEYVDALAVRFWDHDDNPGTALVPHYYLQDANYNVTAVANASGAVVERYAYTPYGEVTILNGASDADGADFSLDPNQVSDIANVYLYTGRELDPETGIQHNRNRPYTPPLGRWLTRDPIEYDYAAGMNLYENVSGAPVHYLDPYGLAKLRPWPESFWPKDAKDCFDVMPGGGLKPKDHPSRCSDADNCASLMDKIKDFERAIRCHRIHDIIHGRPGRHGGEIDEFGNAIDRCWRIYDNKDCRKKTMPAPAAAPATQPCPRRVIVWEDPQFGTSRGNPWCRALLGLPKNYTNWDVVRAVCPFPGLVPGGNATPMPAPIISR